MLQLIIAIVSALPRIAASGKEAWDNFTGALRASGDAELNAQLDRMALEDIRRQAISLAESQS